MPLGALYQYHGGHNRRPQQRVTQRRDQCRRAARLLGKAAHTAGIENEHARLSGATTRLPPNSRDERLRLVTITRCWLSHPIHEPSYVSVGFGQQFEASQFSADRTLEQLGGWQTPFLQGPVQVVR